MLQSNTCSQSYYVSGISNPGLQHFFSDSHGGTESAVSSLDVGSGKLAWLLSGKDFDADDSATRFFGQTIGVDMVPYPFVNDAHKGVYNTRHYYTCDRYSDYSNSSTDEAPGAHSWNDSHYCDVCYTIDPEYMTQDAVTKAYLISNTEQYNTFAGAVNGAYRAKKPMQYASASIQSDLDFSLSAPTVISWLSGRIHGNGHKITLGSANFTSNIATTVGEDGIIEYLDVAFPSTGFYPVVYSNLGRIVGCNITRGIPAGSSAGLVSDCAGELPSSKGLFGRHTRCLIKILTIEGAENYRLYNSNVAYNVAASYTAIPLEKGVSGELAYQLSHAADGQLCLWGQELGTDNDPRICFGQTPASDTFVTRLTSYAVDYPDGIVEYMNAGMGLESVPGYYKVCDDTESWATHPDNNFIVDNGDGTYSAEHIKLDPQVSHWLPLEVDAETFSYNETFEKDDMVSLIFPVDMPTRLINGNVYLFGGYNSTLGQFEFYYSDNLAEIPACTPMLVKANAGSILSEGSYSESYPLALAQMTGGCPNYQFGTSHVASYSSEKLPVGVYEGMKYFRLTGGVVRTSSPMSAVEKHRPAGPRYTSGTSLTAEAAAEGDDAVSPFDSYFIIPADVLDGDVTSIPVVLKQGIPTKLEEAIADSEGIEYPCNVWNLNGMLVMKAFSASDFSRLSAGTYILHYGSKSHKLVIR